MDCTVPTTTRDVRLGIVLNGGVSLAVWIGGVTREIDAARRATNPGNEPGDDGSDTLPLYRKILEALDQRVVVDVIAGASAGGINGVLLAAAIYNGRPLRDLRETWIKLGDFRRLLRSPSLPNPPSLMQGDDIVLTELRRFLREAYEGSPPELKQDLYLYVTATDLFGFTAEFADTTGRTFVERDHRRVFRFEHQEGRVGTGEKAARLSATTVMRDVVWLGDQDAPELLARAGRGSSSFPVAFEAHGLQIVDHEKDGEKVNRHWLVDGGILDNQPFNPVLNRIAVQSAEGPVKRVVMYVVPYVTEVGTSTNQAPELATARDTFSAAGRLPRDLPKLQSLERIRREFEEQKVAEEARRRLRPQLTPAVLETAAASLFDAYKETRATASDAVWKLWASPRFRPGDGALAQDPSTDARVLAPPPRPRMDVAEEAAEERPPPPWLPAQRAWSPAEPRWSWGLAPAERAAFWALMFLRDVKNPNDEDALDRARKEASRLVARARDAKIALQQAFERTKIERPAASLLDRIARAFRLDEERDPAQLDPEERARYAYDAINPLLEELQSCFRQLDEEMAAVGGDPPALRVQSLLDYEVSRNAITIQDEELGFPFEFIFASAGIVNSLGQVASSPDEKLAGMKLGHFGGFLKRSWRANDWLWGRLDGVEHVLRAVLDVERVGQVPGAADALAAIAFRREPEPEFAPEAEAELRARESERRLLQEAWSANAKNLGLNEYVEGDGHQQFRSALAMAANPDTDEMMRTKCLGLCRRALAARIQLRVLAADLSRVAETATDDLRSGSSQIAAGGFWAGRFFTRDRNLRRHEPRELNAEERVSLFKELDIGGEDVKDEASSRLAMEVGSQLVAVAAAMTSGDRGGLPAAARGTLSATRGLTLASSRVLRLMARTPWFGAVVFSALVGLVIWAALAENTLIGTLFPALALLGVVTGVALLTMATSLFERSLTTWPKLLGYAVFAGVPLAFLLLVEWPRLWERFATAVDTHVGSVATSIGSWLSATAFVLAVLRVMGDPIARLVSKRRKRARAFRWRRATITGYRLATIAALLTLAIGFVLERTLNHVESKDGGWVDVANERMGALIVILIVAVLLFASLVQEIWAESRVARAARFLFTR
jgi:patatin-related protein